MRTAIYARYSSDKQNEKSADDQIEACRRYAERQGWHVAATFKDEAISGASTFGRFGLERMMREAASGAFDVVLVEAIDRLSRDQGDISHIRKRLKFQRVDLVTISDGRVDSIRAGVHGLMSELFLDQLKVKTHRGLAAVTRDGRHAGGRSYGYRPVLGKAGELEIVPHEADIVREIFDRYALGVSPRAIVGELNRRGVPGPRGGKWNASTVHGSRARANGVLANRLYVGEIVWNRQSFIKDPDTGKRVSRPNGDDHRIVSKAPHLRILTDEQWAGVNRTPRAQRKPSQRPGKNLLSGLLKCHACGGSYVVMGKDAAGHRVACSTRKESSTCDNARSWSLPKVERKVIDRLKEFLTDRQAIALYIENNTRAYNEAATIANSQRNEMQAEHAALQKKIRRFVDMIGEGIGGREMAAEVLTMEKRQDEIAAELQRQPAAMPSIHPGRAAAAVMMLENLHDLLAVATYDERAALFAQIRKLVTKATIVPDDTAQGFSVWIEGQLAGLLETQAAKGEVVAGTRCEPDLHEFRIVAGAVA